MDIIRLKLQSDLISLCDEFIKESNIQITHEQLENMVHEKVKDVNLKSKNHRNKKSLNSIKSRLCIARVWGDQMGGQCRCEKICNNLCNSHQKMMDKYGVLRFGTVLEDKPTYDLIKLNCHNKKEKLIWYKEDHPMEKLYNILQSHNNKIYNALHPIHT